MSGVRWRYPFYVLLLFFLSLRGSIWTEGELTLLFGFAAEAVAISALLLVLLFMGGDGGKDGSLSSSSSEFPPSLSSSPSDRLVLLDESFDSEVFRANFVP